MTDLSTVTTTDTAAEKPAIRPRNRRKTYKLYFRVDEQTHAAIERLAAQSGRTVSAEVALRLEHSIAMDETADGARVAELLRSMVALAQAAIGPPDTWFRDKKTFALLRTLWMQTLDIAGSRATLRTVPDDGDDDDDDGGKWTVGINTAR